VILLLPTTKTLAMIVACASTASGCFPATITSWHSNKFLTRRVRRDSGAGEHSTRGGHRVPGVSGATCPVPAPPLRLGIACDVSGSIVVVLLPTKGDGLLLRAVGLASIGVGLFGGLIAIIPFRRGERWAWWALWFYPVFWTVHLVGGLPPGKDHVHQVGFIALSLSGLLLAARRHFRTLRPAPARPSLP